MNTSMKVRLSQRLRVCTPTAALAWLALAASPQLAFAVPPQIAISSVPLTVAQPAHPQVIIALGNSQSMDGTLSGAIMTGSGALGTSGGLSLLQSSSSPASFSIPTGFTPPVNAGTGGNAPYTVLSGGNLVDNSPSRLNIAKAGITAILTQYLPYADFGLLDYSTTANKEFTTWVYHMSPPGGFTFTNTATPTAGIEYVPNPCYNYKTLSSTTTVYQDCDAIATSKAPGPVFTGVNTSTLMAVSASSDDPLINDVLYAGSGIDPVCLVYGGPTPASPYTGYALSDYNKNINGNVILETYGNQIDPCARQTGPTNAGYVPFATQTMYAQRGFGYDTGQSATTSNTVQGMTSVGTTPTAAQVAAKLALFAPALAPETNSTSTNEIKANAVQAPTAGLLAGALAYYQTNPATSNGCSTKRYVVLVTDGLPTLDTSNQPWPPPGTVSASPSPNGWGATVAFNGDGSLNTAGTNNQAVLNTVTALQNLASAPATSTASAGIKTFIIGVGAGVDTTANPTAANVLTAMAIAGNTGNYFKAISPGDLVNDMQQILATVLAETGATAAVSVNSTGINTKSLIFQAQFTTSDTRQDWTGNLLAFPILNAATGAVSTTPVWSAQTKLDAQTPSSRVIATWDPVAGKGTPFEWTPGTTATTGIASSTLLGQQLQTFPQDTSGSDVLSYLRGSSTQEQRNGGQFRNRTHTLGDIVDSAPAYVAAPSAPWPQASYAAFEAANVNRAPVIYDGGNDGMLHAFDGTNAATGGSELFAYIPNGVYANLVNLVSPYYNGAHQFYVDGSPLVQDVLFSDSTWHSVLIGSERSGGKSIFALDVTNPSGLTSETAVANAALWEFTDANMGLTYSTPTVGMTAAGFAVFFGNGYDSTAGTPYLYAVNPQTGALLAKINLCAAVPSACNTAVANGLSNVVLANTSGSRALPSTVVYAGDLQGNLWRVDISSPTVANWAVSTSVSVLFQARDPSGNPQPITTTPAVTLNPLFPSLLGNMVYFGTGQLLTVNDLSTTQVQSVYGIFDSGTPPTTPFLRAKLQQQVMSSVLFSSSSGVMVRTLTSNKVVLPTVAGWYVDLSLTPGERVVSDGALFNGSLDLVSYQPNGSLCTAGGTSYFMVFNFATGGSTGQPQFDVNGDGMVNGSDKASNGAVVTGVSLNGYVSGATLLTGGESGGMAYLSQTQPPGPTPPNPLPNPCSVPGSSLGCYPLGDSTARGAWQEIRK